MSRGELPSLAVVIPTCRPLKALKTVVSAVEAYYPGVKRVVVVVNGEGLRPHAEKLGRVLRGVKVLYVKRRNKAAALNAGVRAAPCQLVAILDDDVLITGKTLVKAVSMFKPGVGAVAARTISTKAGFIPSIQRALDNALFHVLRVFLSRAGLSYLNGAFAVIRRELAFFNENARAEDLELSLRIQALGYKIVYAPSLVVLTEPPAGVSGFLKRCLRWGRAALATLVAGVKSYGLRGFLLTIKHALRLGLLTRNPLAF